jgi:DUF1365 family protein
MPATPNLDLACPDALRTRSAAQRHGFAPPEAAALLYPGDVMHARMKPKPHRFAYKVFCLLIDLDRLDEAAASPLFSIGRFNLLSFRESDHGSEDRTAPKGHLRRHVDTLLAPTGIDAAGGRVLLLCYPRMLGFAFNPLSVYFVYAASGEPVAMIYEVRNTFGEMHTYVCPIEDGQMNEAGIRQERDKLFYVSPFMAQEMRYRFRILPPGRAGLGADPGKRCRGADPRRHLHRDAAQLDVCGNSESMPCDAADDPQGRCGHPLGGSEALVQGNRVLQPPGATEACILQRPCLTPVTRPNAARLASPRDQ